MGIGRRGRRTELQPGWPDRMVEFVRTRGPAGRRVRFVRRLTALALLLCAGALALAQQRAPQPGITLVALTEDLPAGATLRASDLTTVNLPRAPDGALHLPDQAVGRVLTGPARRGEVLTDLRLVPPSGPSPGPGRVAVPIRPADPGTVELLGPGMHVAVITLGEKGAATTLAPDAVVLWLPPATDKQGKRLVVVAVPAAAADRIAAASATGAVTLRFT